MADSPEGANHETSGSESEFHNPHGEEFNELYREEALRQAGDSNDPDDTHAGAADTDEEEVRKFLPLTPAGDIDWDQRARDRREKAFPELNVDDLFEGAAEDGPAETQSPSATEHPDQESEQ
jgi:hypothetical protein